MFLHEFPYRFGRYLHRRSNRYGTITLDDKSDSPTLTANHTTDID